MFEDVGLQPPEHVRAQHVVQLLDLVLLRDVGELLQEDLQFTADGNTGESLRRRGRRVRDSTLHRNLFYFGTRVFCVLSHF